MADKKETPVTEARDEAHAWTLARAGGSVAKQDGYKVTFKAKKYKGAWWVFKVEEKT